MFFHVRDLELRAGRFDVERPAGTIEFLDPKLTQTSPLYATGTVELVVPSIGEIRVRGHARVRMEAECDRCLDPLKYPIDSDFELYYRPVSEGSTAEVAIDEGESAIGFYQGDGIELDDVLREFVLLTLPMQQICRENCKGICPVCGQNRNHVTCSCESAKVDDRWAALRSFGK